MITTLGDHRGQYVDLKIQELLGIGKVDSSSAHGRKLQYSNVKAVKAYIELAIVKWKEHKVFERMETLKEKIKNKKMVTMEDISNYNKIDRDVYRLSIHSEIKCLKVSHTKYAWSPRLDLAIKLVRFWKYIVDKGYIEDSVFLKELNNDLLITVVQGEIEDHRSRLKEPGRR